MADYVKALKNYRRQLASSPIREPEVEAPKTPSSGFMSNTRRQQASTPLPTPAVEEQTEYSPANYVSKGMEQIIARRESFVRSVEDRTAKKEEAAPLEALAEGLQSSTATKESQDRAQSITDVADEKQGNAKGSKGLMSRKVRAGRTEDGKTYSASKVVDDQEFMGRVKALATKYGTDPENLLSVMHFETGGSFSPSQRNAAGSSATGLIQFLSSTAEGLGTTTDALANMSRLEQLDYVDKYFAQSPLKDMGAVSGEDLYMSVFWPKAVGKEEDYVLFREGTKAYEQNSGLDSDGKGYITKADAARKALRYVSAYRGV